MARLITVFALLSFTVAVADADVARVRDITPAGTFGETENPDADGNATFTYRPIRQETEIHILITGFLPNTTYGIMATSAFPGPEFSNPAAITTNNKGNGHFRIVLPDDGTVNVSVKVYRWDGDLDSTFDVTADELRAEGDLDTAISRVRNIVPAGPGEVENPEGHGSAFVRYRNGESTVFVRIAEFLPGTTYGVKVENTTGAMLYNVEAITTNGNGRGQFRISGLPDNFSGTVTVTIFRWDGDGSPAALELVTESELRAQGA